MIGSLNNVNSVASMPPISVEIYTKQDSAMGYVPLNGLAYKSSRSKDSNGSIEGGSAATAAAKQSLGNDRRGSQHFGNTSRDESSGDSRKKLLKQSKRALEMDTRKLKQ